MCASRRPSAPARQRPRSYSRLSLISVFPSGWVVLRRRSVKIDADDSGMRSHPSPPFRGVDRFSLSYCLVLYVFPWRSRRSHMLAHTLCFQPITSPTPLRRRKQALRWKPRLPRMFRYSLRQLPQGAWSCLPCYLALAQSSYVPCLRSMIL